MPYVEEREFTVRLELRCEFPDDYDGDEDGFAWVAELPELAAEVVRNTLAAVARRPGWKARPKNRGRSSEDEITLLLERSPASAHGAKP
jgi:hypothetical protein